MLPKRIEHIQCIENEITKKRHKLKFSIDFSVRYLFSIISEKLFDADRLVEQRNGNFHRSSQPNKRLNENECIDDLDNTVDDCLSRLLSVFTLSIEKLADEIVNDDR